MKWRLLVGDVRETLRELPDASVQCCVTSPPYWGLRDYGHAGQIGLEPTPDAYVAEMVAVFREVRRVLKDDGTVWLNLGDSYASGEIGRHDGITRSLAGMTAKFEGGTRRQQARPAGMKPKDLAGIPWMVAFALRDAGWYLRSDIIWSKPNPMPESVTDRPTKAHEYIFLLAKCQRYYYDAEAIREPNAINPDWNYGSECYRQQSTQDIHKTDGDFRRPQSAGQGWKGFAAAGPYGDGRNCRSVWTITTQPYPEAHFATFPEALAERCIKAGSRVGDLVLDPFTGSGTTGKVALRLGRQFVGCELNPAYAALARERIGDAAPLFTEEQSA